VGQTHDHAHAHAAGNRAFAIGVGLNLLFVVVEVIYGLAADSLALIADAGHNLSDVLGLVLAWGAAVMARGDRTESRTFGLKKATVVAAVLNGVLLLGAVGGIVWEAIRRFGSPAPAAGTTIMVVAGIGILVNTATMLLFMRGRHDDLNVRGAFLHMAADAAVSLGVVFAGLAIMLTGLAWIDPVISLVIAGVILLGTWSLLTDSVNLVLDGVPRNVDTRAVRAALADLPEVQEVHDLHIWALSTTETALTAHLVRPPRDDQDTLIRDASEMLRRDHGIGHTTLQVERPTGPCPTGTDC
jgi:cobalt-zinc-cadmium efflux system protein